MNRGPITVRYATALFELGKEKKELDKLYTDSKLLLDHCLSVKDFCAFINNPVIKPSQKKKVIHKVLSGEQHPIMLKFVDLVIERNREPLLGDMIRYFEYLYKKFKGIKSVQIITASSLDESYFEELKSYIEREFDAPVEMEAKVKPEIIGGLILVVDDKIIDNSIIHQMKLIKQKFLS
ncbi:ATP synthase F1 subunit delta [Marinilabilia rubra]|uniref:ATP synthase subunit delta n=1 Tax=Marinilabilia rubra TaxID=2162893 RepID=A0A2U2B8S4_9BACT|nr:ATP synthase F1 subunit delta [Marinilabilia rubra]PWD99465.1 ATP synthase F1 subunit delta [Marinilabilia rubra]